MRIGQMKDSVTCVVAFLVSMTMFAAEGWAQPTAISVQCSDPSRPGTVSISLVQGDINVTGYDGENVVVSTTNRITGFDEEEVPERARGLRRIGGAGGVNITERNNVITIEIQLWMGSMGDLTVRVPRDTSLELTTMTGEIRIAAVDGEVEVQTTTGDVYLTDLSGPAVVHAQNGEVVGTFTSVTGDMPISVTTMNGEIDLTLPSSADATLAINTWRGDIYSDFDVSLEVRSTDGTNGDELNVGGPRLRISRNSRIAFISSRDGGPISHVGGRILTPFFHGVTSQTLFGDINDGGAEVSLSTFNGNIYIRRGN